MSLFLLANNSYGGSVKFIQASQQRKWRDLHTVKRASLLTWNWHSLQELVKFKPNGRIFGLRRPSSPSGGRKASPKETLSTCYLICLSIYPSVPGSLVINPNDLGLSLRLSTKAKWIPYVVLVAECGSFKKNNYHEVASSYLQARSESRFRAVCQHQPLFLLGSNFHDIF